MLARLSLRHRSLDSCAGTHIARAQLAGPHARPMPFASRFPSTRTARAPAYEFDPAESKSDRDHDQRGGKTARRKSATNSTTPVVSPRGEVFSGDGKFRFKTRLQIRCRRASCIEETQLDQAGRAAEQDRLFLRRGGEADGLRGLRCGGQTARPDNTSVTYVRASATCRRNENEIATPTAPAEACRLARRG